MREVELNFRDRLGEVLGAYCPNDSVLNVMSFYLYREAISILRDSLGDDKELIINEVLSTDRNSELDKPSFMGAIKSFSSFSSQIILDKALKKAIIEVRNQYSLLSRDFLFSKESLSNSSNPSSGKSNNVNDSKNSSYLVYDGDLNTGEFDFDIDSIPEVSPEDAFTVNTEFGWTPKSNNVSFKKPKPDISETVHEKPLVSYTLDENIGEFNIDIDEINMTSSRSGVSRRASTLNSKSSGTSESESEKVSNFNTDASIYKDGSFSDVSKLSFDEDY